MLLNKLTNFFINYRNTISLFFMVTMLSTSAVGDAPPYEHF